MNRAAALLSIVFACLGLGACTVGGGSGRAQGTLFVQGCGTKGENYSADPDMLVAKAFDLTPTFFAANPIEDIARGGILANRLIIRMQRTGNSVEVTDTLYFDVRNAYEIARCLRGRTIAGVPDWDVQGGWCDWTGGAGGAVRADRPRIYLGPKNPVSASLSLLYTCSRARVVGVAVDRGGSKGSWIDFTEFGTALQPQVANSDDRDPILGDFKVDFNQGLEADFRVDLEDEYYIEAMEEMDPLPRPRLGGVIGGSRETGFFSFTMERGRAAQPFP